MLLEMGSAICYTGNGIGNRLYRILYGFGPKKGAFAEVGSGYDALKIGRYDRGAI
jgi:hypothetical protein